MSDQNTAEQTKKEEQKITDASGTAETLLDAECPVQESKVPSTTEISADSVSQPTEPISEELSVDGQKNPLKSETKDTGSDSSAGTKAPTHDVSRVTKSGDSCKSSVAEDEASAGSRVTADTVSGTSLAKEDTPTKIPAVTTATDSINPAKIEATSTITAPKIEATTTISPNETESTISDASGSVPDSSASTSVTVDKRSALEKVSLDEVSETSVDNTAASSESQDARQGSSNEPKVLAKSADKCYTSEQSSIANSDAVSAAAKSVPTIKVSGLVSLPSSSSERNVSKKPVNESIQNESDTKSEEYLAEKDRSKSAAAGGKNEVDLKKDISDGKGTIICGKTAGNNSEKPPSQAETCHISSSSSVKSEKTLLASDNEKVSDSNESETNVMKVKNEKSSNGSKTADSSEEKSCNLPASKPSEVSKTVTQISKSDSEQQEPVLTSVIDSKESPCKTGSKFSKDPSLQQEENASPSIIKSSIVKSTQGSAKTLEISTSEASNTKSIRVDPVGESQESSKIESDVKLISQSKNLKEANPKGEAKSEIDQTDECKIKSDMKVVAQKSDSKSTCDISKEGSESTSNIQADLKMTASNLENVKSDEVSVAQKVSEKSDLLSAIEAVKVEAEIMKSKQKVEKSSDIPGKEEVSNSTARKLSTERQASSIEDNTNVDNKATAFDAPPDNKLNGSSVPSMDVKENEKGKPEISEVSSTNKNLSTKNNESNPEASPSVKNLKPLQVPTTERKRAEENSQAESKIHQAESKIVQADKSIQAPETPKTDKQNSKESSNICSSTLNEATSKNSPESAMEMNKKRELSDTCPETQASSNDGSKKQQVSRLENEQDIKEPVTVVKGSAPVSAIKSPESSSESKQNLEELKADVKTPSNTEKSVKVEVSVSAIKQVEKKQEVDSRVPSKVLEPKIILKPLSKLEELKAKSGEAIEVLVSSEKSKKLELSSPKISENKEKAKPSIEVTPVVEKAVKSDPKTKENSEDFGADDLSPGSKITEVSSTGIQALTNDLNKTKAAENEKLKSESVIPKKTKQTEKPSIVEITIDDASEDASISPAEVKKDAENLVGVESKKLSVVEKIKSSSSSKGDENTKKSNLTAEEEKSSTTPEKLEVSEVQTEKIKEILKESPVANRESFSSADKPENLEEPIKKGDDSEDSLDDISIIPNPKEPVTSQVVADSKQEKAKPAETGNAIKTAGADDKQEASKSSEEEPGVNSMPTANKSLPGPVKPKTTKVMPSLREIRKIPQKPETGTGGMSMSIVKRPRLSVSDSDSGGPASSSSSAEKVSKPRFSIENDPLLNITSECRVELEITKIPANCQLKTEPGGKPVFVLNRNSAGPSTQDVNKKPKTLLRNFMAPNQPNQAPLMKRMGRPPKDPNRMIQVSPMDASMLNRPRPTVSKRGRKRAMTIDMARQPGPHSPAMKMVRTDPHLKHRMNMAQMQRMYRKSGPSGPSPKTTSALEMLLMNRGVTHNPPISDASVANFCQVEELVTEPDMYSTPIKQLKSLSKGPANSILKQIAYGSQQFGAITISPVNPSPMRMPPTPTPQATSFRPGPRPGPRPAHVSRSSSIDDIIDSVAAGEGEISPKCLLELNSAGEPKKKRGRPRKIVPGQPAYSQFQSESLQCAPDLFFMQQGHQPSVRPTPPKVSAPDGVSTPSPLKSAPAPSTPVTPESFAESFDEPSEILSSEVEEGGEKKKLASGRAARMCTIKEPKKKKDGATPKTGEKSPKKKKKDEEPAEPDPEEEARKLREAEEEAKRKAELKEKRLQERQKRTELRTKLLAEKKAKLKRRAEERKRQYYEKKRKLQEEKAEMERRRALAPPENFSEETQMGDENDSVGDLIRNKKGRMEVIDPESSKEFKVHQVAEYQWPLQGGEFFMLQEQISQYLGIKSFKRKYPDIKRRTVEAEERTFLCDSGLVSETMCDLGLTALRSADVLDIMFADFHDKYEEFRQHLRDMQAKEFSLKQLALAGKPTGEQLTSIEKAVQSAARWNSTLNKSRQESRKCCLDLQTFVIQYPKPPKGAQDSPKIGSYPISLIPGQFTDYYKRYSAAELRYLPLNTVLYGPIKPYNVVVRESRNTYFSESEDSSSSGSSCSSSDDSDSEESVKEAAMETEVSGQEGAICKICNGNRNKNKRNVPEVLIQCAQCTGCCHPSCLDLAPEMVPHIQRYDWQCTDCKRCAQCKEVSDEDKMLFCDLCDRGYHIYCVGLRKVPVGRWHCQECAVCASCAVHEPGPGDAAQWHHEFKKGGKGSKNIYVRSFCENCAKDQTPAEGNILRRES
nr:PREDICTED: uncharacterized protein LOC109044279 [Bemisia tabaci]